MPSRVPIQTETHFGPETIKNLALALDDAWDRIQKSDGSCAGPFYARTVRAVLARRINKMVQWGELDVRRLSDDAVLFLAKNYK